MRLPVLEPPAASPRLDQPATSSSPPLSRAARWWRGSGSDPAWVRPALVVLLGATALLYLWGLSASGWANGFYSAAVEAGSKSWKAMFFGSFDSSNFITVDKPPASLWVMDLSARIFGLNSWSILVPQAVEGVAAVGFLYASIRRRFSAAAGLLAGAALALTPVATLMFRFNNPDALLVLLLVAAAYAVVRAVEAASSRWLALAGMLVGFGFLSKMLQAMLVVPGFAFVYLYAAPAPLRRRVKHLLVSGAAMVVSAGWWVATVALWPVSARPYIGGSQHNSIIELIFGYNGLGRLTGQETGSVGGANNASGRWGSTGLLRMFNSEFGGQVSWLLPASLVLLLGLLWLLRRAPRTDARRAQVLVWGSWLLVTGLAFSLGKGIIHPYYAVALAPAVAALVGIGAVHLWRQRQRFELRAVLAIAMALTAWWSYDLLSRSPSWHPATRTWVLTVGLAAATALFCAPLLSRRLAATVATVAIVVGLAGPAAYAVQTASTGHTGAIPSAGPATTAGPGGAGGPGGVPGRQMGLAGRPPGAGALAGGPPGGFAGNGGGPAGGRGRGGAVNLGGLLDTATPSATLVQALTTNASAYTWIAATIGSNNAAGIQIATGQPVMAIGGFNGTDPTPTLAEFERLVRAGKIHYFIGGAGGLGGSSTANAIVSWVQSRFTGTTIGGATVYDLTAS